MHRKKDIENNMKKEHKTHKIAPKEYLNVLHDVELLKMGFLEIKSKLYPENLSDATIDVNTDNKVQINTVDKNKILAAVDTYLINATIDKKKIFDIEIKLLAIFECRAELSKEFLDLFEKNTLKVIVYPYVRQTVQDLTSKMGIEPFIMPMWRVPSGAKKELLKPSQKRIRN